MEFKDKIKLLREEKQLSQEQLGDILGVNQTTVSSWELGKKYPDFFNIISIAQFFKVSADFLLGLKEY